MRICSGYFDNCIIVPQPHNLSKVKAITTGLLKSPPIEKPSEQGLSIYVKTYL